MSCRVPMDAKHLSFTPSDVSQWHWKTFASNQFFRFCALTSLPQLPMALADDRRCRDGLFSVFLAGPSSAILRGRRVPRTLHPQFSRPGSQDSVTSELKPDDHDPRPKHAAGLRPGLKVSFQLTQACQAAESPSTWPVAHCFPRNSILESSPSLSMPFVPRQLHSSPPGGPNQHRRILSTDTLPARFSSRCSDDQLLM